MGIDDAGTVGAQQPNTVSICDLFHPQLYLLAFRTKLCKTCGLNHNVAHTALAALFNDIRRHTRRDQDDGHVNWFRHSADAWISLEALNLVCLGIDRIKHTSEVVADKIGEDVPAQFSGSPGGADDGDALRIKEVVKILFDQSRRCRTRLAQNYAGVNRHVAVRIEEYGIQVHFSDIGILHHIVRYSHQQVYKPLDIDRVAAIPFQESIAFDLLYHILCIRLGDGNGPEGYVHKNLDKYATQTKHQHRPECGIIRDSHDDLYPRPGHLLHGDAFHLFARERSNNIPKGSSHLICVLQVELDSACIGFMNYIRGEHLQGHGRSKRDEYLCGLIFRPCHNGFSRGNPEALQNGFALMLHQISPADRLRLIYNLFR